MPDENALTGVRVLEISNGGGAAWCGKILADFGAEIFRVGGLDDSPKSFYLNLGKRVTALDPREDDGRKRIRDLLSHADILIEDLDAEGRATAIVNPPSSLVWCSITPFGTTGPYADFKGQHLNIFQAGSEGSVTPSGEAWDLFPERPPLQFGGDIADYDTGAVAAIAVLASYRESRRTGRGQTIDVSAQEAELTVNRSNLTRYNFDKVELRRISLPALAIRIFACTDGFVQLAGIQDEVWRSLAALPEGAVFADERFQTFKNRITHADLLRQTMLDWCSVRTRREVVSTLAPLGFAVGPHSTVEDLAASSQLQHRNFFQTVEHPQKGHVRVPGVPYQLSATPVRIQPSISVLGHELALPRQPRPPISAPWRPPLENIRILDLTWAAAGPYATMLLGLLGAEIIKVESSKRPDAARRGFQADYGGTNKSPNFNELNLNKRSFQLDLTNSLGQELAQRLLPLCDMVIDNFRPNVMRRLGLDASSILAEYPRMIVGSSSTNGSTGPEAMTAGYAPIFAAGGGICFETGYPDGPPTEVGDSMDYRSGHAFAVALLAALLHRDRTGKGQFIDISSTEVVIAGAPNALLDHLFGLPPRGRPGNRHPRFAPHNVYPASGSDAWISIAVTTEPEWQALCGLIGKPDWTQLYPSAAARKAHEDAIDAEIARWTRTQAVRAAFLALQQRGIPSAPTFTNKDIASDEHLAARGVFVDVEHPDAGTHRLMRGPWRFTDPSTSTIRRHGPLLGQDNDYVLGELLGLSPAEQAKFTEALC